MTAPPPPRPLTQAAALGLTVTLLTLAALAVIAAEPTRDVGPDPQLPDPHPQFLPTTQVAKAVGWSAGAKPVPRAGLVVSALATGLDHPRWIYVLPNGDVLVAESNTPAEGEKSHGGLKGWITGLVMGKAGAGVKSPDRIVLLRDANGDGTLDEQGVFADASLGLHSPFGMVLIGENFYVANTDSILRYAYKPGQKQLVGPPVKVADLPGGSINHHWTKNLVASADGTKLYASVGSNSNAAENGIEAETSRASILEIDIKTGASRIFASGLRNPVGMAWQPETDMLWTSVNERDELGDDLVPDYMTAVHDGAFYGWPYSYYGPHLDPRVKPQRPDLVAKAVAPDYALGAHTASLGLAAASAKSGTALGAPFASGMFVGQHGSWNRSQPAGYRVVFVPFSGGKPSGMPIPVLTGFLDAQGQAMGRPVGVALDKSGALLVADDVGNAIWRVTLAH